MELKIEDIIKPDINIEKSEADRIDHVDTTTGNPIDSRNSYFDEIFLIIVIKNNSDHILSY